jgi:hypothetical protein
MLRPTVSRAVCLDVKPHLGLKTRFLLLSVCCCGAPSLTDLSFTIVAGPRQHSHSRVSGSRGTHDHILLSQIRDCPQPGGSGPRIYVPQEHSGPVIPTGTGGTHPPEVVPASNFDRDTNRPHTDISWSSSD